MQQKLKVLFATTHPHVPQIAGGLQASTADTMRLLTARGHETTLLCGLTGSGFLGMRHRLTLKLGHRLTACDRASGPVTYRAWFPDDAAVVDEVIHRFAPDVVLSQGGGAVRLAKIFDQAGIPALIHFRNVEFDGLSDAINALDKHTVFIANSRFTQTRAKREFGVDARVIYPIVDATKYRILPQGSHCVFINPHPSKGIDIALGVAAACPDIPVLIVEAWTLDGPEIVANRNRAAALPNVTWLSRTEDMRRVYSMARLMLVPSRWEEAFGRVVAEAQVSGIPSVASAIGGLPEAVGSGGLLLPHDAPVADWAAAVRRVWDTPAEHARLASAALYHAARPEMQADQQITQLETAIRDRLRKSVCGAEVVPFDLAQRG